MKILILLAFGHPNQGSQLAQVLIHKSFCEFYLLPRSIILLERKKTLFRQGSLIFNSNVMDFNVVMAWGQFIRHTVLCTCEWHDSVSRRDRLHMFVYPKIHNIKLT